MNNLTNRRVWVAGHRGMVGAAVARRLESEGCEVLEVNRDEVNLEDQKATLEWVQKTKPDTIVLAAAKVGGIYANDNYPVDFLESNLSIQINVMRAAHICDAVSYTHLTLPTILLV